MTNALPNFMNFVRSISPSEGLLEGINASGGKAKPVLVVEKTVRGSISNYMPAAHKVGTADASTKEIAPEKGTAKGDAAQKAIDEVSKELDPSNANIQRVDVAFLPEGADRLKLSYSIIVQANSLAPASCNDGQVRDKIATVVKAFTEKGGYDHLATLYAWNLLNGRTLWRNRIARNKRVTIDVDGTVLAFEGDGIPTFKFDPAQMPADAKPLIEAISGALSGKREALFLKVSIDGELPPGAEVYPSQEFVEGSESKTKKKGQKSKSLAFVQKTLDEGVVNQASMHSQKIGNALRTIDVWHRQVDEIGALAVEPYGFSQSLTKTLRMSMRAESDGPQAVNFYDLMTELDELASKIEGAKDGNVPPEALYFVAVLVRGGVFSGEKKDKGPKKDAKAEGKGKRGKKSEAETVESGEVQDDG